MTDAETTKPVPPAFPEEAPEAGSGKMISAMGAIGLIAGILIVFTYQVTFPFIQDNKARLLEKAIFEVVPGAATKRVFTVDAAGKVTEVAEADPKQLTLYACYKSGGGLAGVALEASGQGFQDVIRVIYGYDPQKEVVVGMKVLQSTETPGLGDKIEKDPQFLDNFEALDVKLNPDGDVLVNTLEMVKSGQKTDPWQISAITGATISSRAITAMLRESTAKNIPLIVQRLPELQKGD